MKNSHFSYTFYGNLERHS